VNDPTDNTASATGIASALAAFFLWGILPLYWKTLGSFPASNIIAHRTVWALAILWGILFWQRKGWDTLRHLADIRIVIWHAISGLLLGCNWLLYVWATLHDHVIDAALGYYLNPFFNMLFGYYFFAERQNRLQQISIGIALAGVVIQFRGNQGFPWIAVALALSFSLYAVVRKRSPLGSLPGLSLETLILAPLALLWLGISTPSLFETLQNHDRMTWLLMSTGIATAAPLLCFGHAARSISLTTLGILQFLGPTLQFLIGWLIYRESMSVERTGSFVLIWVAIALYGHSLRKNFRTGISS
jgi:chloramphenicol-sensitive protein RarD